MVNSIEPCAGRIASTQVRLLHVGKLKGHDHKLAKAFMTCQLLRYRCDVSAETHVRRVRLS